MNIMFDLMLYLLTSHLYKLLFVIQVLLDNCITGIFVAHEFIDLIVINVLPFPGAD